jgi:hypothetical protein
MRNALIAVVTVLFAAALAWLVSSPAGGATGPTTSTSFSTTPTTVEAHFGRLAAAAGGAGVGRAMFAR